MRVRTQIIHLFWKTIHKHSSKITFMKIQTCSSYLLLFLITSFLIPFTTYCKAQEIKKPYHATNKITIPVGGNSFTQPAQEAENIITNVGIKNWTNPKTVIRTYFRLAKSGNLTLSVKAKSEGKSKISISILDKTKTLNVDGESEIVAGEWQISKPGYIAVELRGISKTGSHFAEIPELHISGSAVDENLVYVKNNEGNYFYWGRRGPSVHLGYKQPEGKNIEWFYNEVKVPVGQDVQGSYYMANGFKNGYFGMQVNSPTERRILFSIWSPFVTDDPKSIPEDQRVKLLKKGVGVTVNDFGNEGSGGQSYLRFNWKAGSVYKYLLKCEPKTTGSTIYTAYFFAPEENSWRLIASWERPKTNAFLTGLHSFLENFDPAIGNISRRVQFNNQWVRDTEGNWIELTTAKFTADATARKGYRVDYAGGMKDGSFFLQNCGFFNDTVPFDQFFTRPAGNRQPEIDFSMFMSR